MNISGAEIVIRCIKEQGEKVIFGYPGGRALALYDALFSSGLEHVLMTNEQHAVHAAVGYARVTGRAGIVFATSGPGATNLVTGIANAYMDSAPVVIVTCNVPRSKLGTDAFQEIDIAGVTMPITKYNAIASSAEKLPQMLRQAFQIAESGRQGPVLIDIPEDVLFEKGRYIKETRREPARVIKWSGDDIARAAALINESSRPTIYAGGGVVSSGAERELYLLSEKLDAPVGMSMMGLSSYPPSGRNWVGMIGSYGRKRANAAIDDCDLLIAIGARFSERTAPVPEEFAKNAKVLHIDVDAAEINKNRQTDMFLVGDAKEALLALLPLTEEKSRRPVPLDAEGDVGGVRISCRDELAYECFGEIDRAAGDSMIYTTDVGDHQLWATKYIEFSGRKRLITSGGLGAMGFGLGAAIGASIGGRGAKVINISGDGSFLMNAAELATISRLGLPVTDIVINNKALGLVRRQQQLFFGGRESQSNTDWPVDYPALARSFGLAGYRIEEPKDIGGVLAEIFASKKGAVVEIDAVEE